MVEQVVIDRCIRWLPMDAKMYAAQQGAPTLETLIALLENHRVMGNIMPENSRVTPRGF